MGLPEPQLQPELILRGQLEDLDVGTLLSALRLGRQYLTLELFDAAGESKGRVSVKSGRIISALAGDQSGAAAVRQLLETHDASEFRVQMQPSDAELEADPVGTISELAQAGEPDLDSDVERLTERTQILQGVLNERLTLDEVLHVVAFTRQHVSVELSDRAGNTLGEVRAKAGKILSARAGDLVELPALQELLRASADTRFVLFTEAASVAQLRPLGSLTDVLSRAREQVGDAAAPPSNGFRKTAPPPLPRPTRPPSHPQRTRILEGNLDEFELSHVLKVLSTSRQHFELHVRDDAAASVGMIEVKSGIVIGASTDKLTGIAAARELLQATTGRFVAIRRAEATGDRPALVSVSELLQPKAAGQALDDLEDLEDAFENTPALSLTNAIVDEDKQQVPTAAAPITVLHGKLGDLDVASILHVAGASRQYTCVHIFDDQRQPLGAVHLKSGHVVRAKAQDTTGIAAVRRLLHSPRDFSYLVQRYPNASDVTASIGSIAIVLERAATPVKPARVATTSSTTLTPVPSAQATRPSAANSNWMGGALVGAGFVLLGGIATAIVLRSPALNTTTVSAISTPPPVHELAPASPPAPRAGEPSVEQAHPAATSGTATSEAATPATLSRATIASFQAGLRQLGYETGPIDGVIGPRTAAAIKAFQYAEHLAVDGTLSAPARAVLLRRIGEP